MKTNISVNICLKIKTGDTEKFNTACHNIEYSIVLHKKFLLFKDYPYRTETRSNI